MERWIRVLVGIAFGSVVALVSQALDIYFGRLGIPPSTTLLNDFMVGSVAAFLAYVWVTLLAERKVAELSAVKLEQEAIVGERNRMAHELHDTVAQVLAGIVMQLEAAESESSLTDSSAREHMFRALGLARDGLIEMRRSLSNLLPEALHLRDLPSAIALLTKGLTNGTAVRADFSSKGMPRQLPEDIQKSLLRISQEALTNVVKHAQATEVQVELFLDSRWAHLRVKDNGQGVRRGCRDRGFGLTVMQDRAKALGGSWWIESEPGLGTQVRASIPLPPATQ